MRFEIKKRGQVTIFVILAILIVSLVALYFLILDSNKSEKIPEQFGGVYQEFYSCLEDNLVEGDLILKSQGGVIDAPLLERNSLFYPFSNKLEYGGVKIPYWFYYSASGIPKESVPLRINLEEELEIYLNKKWNSCRLEVLDSELEIFVDDPSSINVEILDNKIQAEIESELFVSNGVESSSINDHYIEINSNLGNLFESARKVFEEEKNNFLIGNYSIDVLRLYAPVDGVELSCAPLSWNANQIFSDVSKGLEQNLLMINNLGVKDDYYDLGMKIKEDVNVVYSPYWPSFFQVDPSQDSLMIATPVGNQQGLGILGFCYVPYHFVYDARFPILIQVSQDGETFQFPMILSIEKNSLKKNSLNEELLDYEDVCEIKGGEVNISVYDLDLNNLDGINIYYDCLGQSCFVGSTENGIYSGNLPSCVNGILKVQGENYKPSSLTYSSIQNGSAIFVLNKFYPVEIKLNVEDKSSNQNSIITFSSEDYSFSLNYPEQKRVNLPEGDYGISVSIYENASFKIPSVTEHCFDVPRSGFGGLLGLSSRECVEFQISEDFSSSVLIGGGKTKHYFKEEDLRVRNSIILEIEELFNANSFEDLQKNYNLVENTEIEVRLE
jgi:hypothetical protein